MGLSKQATRTLISLVQREVNNLSQETMDGLAEEPDRVDTQWFTDRVKRKDNLTEILDELHTYERTLRTSA